jgi:long-chain acyl-CoA synthetase
MVSTATINRDTTVIDNRPANVAQAFLDRVGSSAGREAFRYPQGAEWASVTWQQVGEQVERLAGGLLALGLEQEQRVGIAASTRYEWVLADLAVMCAGGATTTVYPSTMAEDVAYIVADAECRIVFAEDEEQVAKLRAHRAELPTVETVVVLDGAGSDEGWVISLADLAERGATYVADNPGRIRRSPPRSPPTSWPP